MLKYYIKVYTR